VDQDAPQRTIPPPIYSEWTRDPYVNQRTGRSDYERQADHDRGWFRTHRHLYPDNWDAIATAVKERAHGQCEACLAPHGKPPHVLTVDHLNHTPADCSETNLIALCQRCHLRRQAMRPRPASRAHAIARLRARIENDAAQLAMRLET